MMRPNTKRVYIDSLEYLSRYLNYKKSFKEMTREDIVEGYLKSLKKTFDEDQEEKW